MNVVHRLNSRLRLPTATACVLGPVALLLILTLGCDGDKPFVPRPGVSGRILLENQSNHSGVLVRLAPLDSVTVTREDGSFSFSDIPDGRWRVEAKYPYFEIGVLSVDVEGGLQRNGVGQTLRQLLRFWVELPDTLVSICECNEKFVLEIVGHVQNLTGKGVELASPSTPMEDYAIIPQLRALVSSAAPAGSSPGGQAWGERTTVDTDRAGERSEDPCAAYGWLLSGELDFPGHLSLLPREERVMPLTATPLAECFAPGRYEVFWTLADDSFFPEHFNFMRLDLNTTLLGKPQLIAPATLRIVPSGAQ